ncbi:unnamed protein product [Adineta ricciae]|uniref:Uncharacterized protein n=1 Tax=Adineta ricciae TaxID=249248 RepID=A0A814STX9_ADIRI|nr:unnamed protein product [Adineta ricciae]CAF1522176.1 unnamed protein product [Adineta ricciae]
MLVSSSATNDYQMSTIPPSMTAQSVRVRTRTLRRCEPAWPSRDYVRQENYARRKVQEHQGWACPRTIPYQDVAPPVLSPRSSRPIITEQPTIVISDKITSKTQSSETSSNRPKSSSTVQDDHLTRLQFETTLRDLQSARQQYMKKSSDILRGVKLGRSAKDVVEKLSRNENVRVQSVEINKPMSAGSDEKDQDALYDRLIDDFDDDDDDDDGDGSESGIRDDIMSPRTMVNAHTTRTDPTNARDLQKSRLDELLEHPVKLCHSAPPLNRKNFKRDIIRPFTPHFNRLSSRLRLKSRMSSRFKDALYRQLCCILWFLRAMCSSEPKKKISGCWNIDQWQEKSKGASRANVDPSETSSEHRTDTSQDETMSFRPQIDTLDDSMKKPHTHEDPRMFVFPQASIDSRSATRVSTDSDEIFHLPINSTSYDRDLNESASSRSHHEDTIQTVNLDSTQPTVYIPRSSAASISLTGNTSRASFSSDVSQPPGGGAIVRIPSILEQRRQPNALLKKWVQSQKITIKTSKNALPIPLPLADKEIRLLRVGDASDLNHIFGLENATSTSREQVRARQNRAIEQKLVVNLRRRSASNIGVCHSKERADELHSLKREFDEFTEEQMTTLNNRLQQIDKNRLFYYQSKLNDMQKLIPQCTLSEKLLVQLRFDKNKQKQNAFHLRYRPWYIDLKEMVEPEYHDNQLILCLLKEMREYADPSHTPTAIRFKSILRDLMPHEICHPDIMAAIEFVRVHIVEMGIEDFDSFFRKHFPQASKYLNMDEETSMINNNEKTI